MKGISLYVHVPFCAARCPYCDFATAPAASALRGRFIEALAADVAREGAALGHPRVRTAYFGGGTPSLLEPGEIGRIGEAIQRAFKWRPREVTFEANPATLDRARRPPAARRGRGGRRAGPRRARAAARRGAGGARRA